MSEDIALYSLISAAIADDKQGAIPPAVNIATFFITSKMIVIYDYCAMKNVLCSVIIQCSNLVE